MSTKFEQLLDFLVNEDHEKANELFHEIVVEKSREIYENLIAEEETEDMEETAEDADESVEAGADEDAEESMDLEESYMMDGDDTGDSADDFGGEISADGDNFDAPADDENDHEDHEDQEDTAIMDIKNAIQELEAAFAELEAAQSGEEADMDMEPEVGDTDGEDEGMGFMEGRRMTREYVEKVGHDYGKAQKTDGDDAGAGTGERQSKPLAGKSPVSSGSGKPQTGAGPISSKDGTVGNNTGTSPAKVNKGINPEKSEQFTGKEWEANSKPGAHTKGYTKKEAGWPQGGKTAGPVGSGSGDKAGQTSVAADKPFLKKI